MAVTTLQFLVGVDTGTGEDIVSVSDGTLVLVQIMMLSIKIQFLEMTRYPCLGDNTINSGSGNDTISLISGENIIDAGDGDDIITASGSCMSLMVVLEMTD